MARTSRRWLLPLLGALGAAAIAITLVFVAVDDTTDDPAAAPVVTTPALPASLRDVRFPRGSQHAGFSDVAFLHYGLGDRYDLGVSPTAEAEWARGAGATIHRIGFEWRQAEPRRGELDQGYIARVTALVDRFEAAGGRVLVFFFAAPRWARSSPACPGECIAPPALTSRGMRAWRQFVRLTARTFPTAYAFEVWNEPNLGGFWAPRPDPQGYARLANAAYSELRQAAPRANLLVGALAPVADRADAISPARFLNKAAEAGLETRFDAVSWHAYPSQLGGRVAAPGGAKGVRVTARSVADGIRLYEPFKRQWVTEMGITRTGKDWGVAPEEQAVALIRLYDYLSRLPRMNAVLIHQLVENTPMPADSVERGFGIVRPLGRDRQAPTPAWCALRAIAADPGPEPLDARCIAGDG